jgi:hypothetical protein
MGQPYGFSRGPRGNGLRVRLDEVERLLLISLADQMVSFVAPPPRDPDADPLAEFVGIDESAEVPDDPALARLFPDAFIDDPDAAAEFRRFTERGLRERKAANARIVRADLDDLPARLPDDHVTAWLGFLNDTRLALGARLDVTEENLEEYAHLPDDDPRAAMFQVYDWLTFLEDSLVQHLMP